MTNKTWRAFVDDQPQHGRRDLYIVGPGPTGARSVVQPLELGLVSEGLVTAPCASETREQQQDGPGLVTGLLQAMLDQAWAMGMRPAGYDAKDQGAELAAVRYHLEDMRLLAKVRNQ